MELRGIYFGLIRKKTLAFTDTCELPILCGRNCMWSVLPFIFSVVAIISSSETPMSSINPIFTALYKVAPIVSHYEIIKKSYSIVLYI